MTTTAATVATQAGAELAFYIRIEGIGHPDSPSKMRYVFTRLPDWVAGANQEFVTGLSIPGSWSQSVDAIGGVEAPSSLSFELAEFYDSSGRPSWGRCFATGRYTNDGTTYPSTLMTTAKDTDDTTFQVGTTAAFAASGHIYVGNETIAYSSKNAGSFNGLSRGLHNPSTHPYDYATARWAYPHRLDDGSAIDGPTVATHPYSFFGRKVVLYCVHRAQDGTWGTEADALKLWTGRILRRMWAGQRQSWRLDCQSIMADLDRSVMALPLPDYHLYGLWLGATLEDRTVEVVYYQADGDEQNRYDFALDTWYRDADALVTDWNELSQAAATAASAPCVRIGNSALSTGAGSGDYNPSSHTQWVLSYAGDTGWSFVNYHDARLSMGNGVRLALDIGENERVAVPNEAGGVDAAIAVGLVGQRCALSYDDTGGPRSTFYERYHVSSAVVHCYDIGADSSHIITAQGDYVYGWGALQQGDRFVCFVQPSSAGSSTITCSTHDYDSDIPGPYIAATSNGANFVEGSESIRFRSIVRPSETTLPSPPTLSTVLQRLMLSVDGEGNNGSYDVYPTGVGVAIDANDVDTSALVEAFAGAADAPTDWALLKPTKMRELLDEVCKAYGVMCVMQGGQITFRSAPTIVTASMASYAFGDGTKAREDERCDIAETPDGLYNSLEFKVGYNPFADEWRDTVSIVDQESVDTYGQGRSLTFQLRNIHARPLASTLADLALKRQSLWRWPYQRISRSFDRSRWGLVAPGMVVTLTDRWLPDPFTGEFGITARVCVVESVSHDYQGGSGSVVLRMLPMQHAAPFAPSALVSAVVQVGSDAKLTTTTLYAAAGATNSAESFEATDAVLIVQTDAANPASPQFWRTTATAVGSNYITVDTDVTTVAASGAGGTMNTTDHQYVVTFDVFGSLTASQKLRGSSIAGADGIISGTQSWYPWCGGGS